MPKTPGKMHMYDMVKIDTIVFEIVGEGGGGGGAFKAHFFNSLNHAFNPIRSGLFQTVNDPGGGGFKSSPPYDLENYRVNLYHIIYVNFTRCFWHDPIGIF